MFLPQSLKTPPHFCDSLVGCRYPIASRLSPGHRVQQPVPSLHNSWFPSSLLCSSVSHPDRGQDGRLRYVHRTNTNIMHGWIPKQAGDVGATREAFKLKGKQLACHCADITQEAGTGISPISDMIKGLLL